MVKVGDGEGSRRGFWTQFPAKCLHHPVGLRSLHLLRPESALCRGWLQGLGSSQTKPSNSHTKPKNQVY